MSNKNGHDDEEEASNVHKFPGSREMREIEQRMRVANDRKPAREPILNLPPVVKWLCLALIVIQAVLEVMPEQTAEEVVEALGFYVPRYTGGMPFGWEGAVAPFTHMFLHGGWLHLAVNVLTLAAFGAGIERTIGGKKLTLLFLVTGIIGAFTHVVAFVVYGAASGSGLFQHPEAPLIGASGGISGLFGAVLMMAQDRGLMGGYAKLAPFVVIWIIISLFFGVYGMPGAEGPIAWTTHIGGFIAGLLLYRPVARMKL
jgi:membrane associated rhomboid family serine protease